MAEIRPYRAEDLEALYDICLKTGDSGRDASHLHRDPRVVGDLYAAPYCVLSPQTALVAQDQAGVGGYIVGALDTPAFEDRLEAEWWPALRSQYAAPDRSRRDTWGYDEHRAWLIHHPERTPRYLTERWPSHLHINFLPRMQGVGLGQAMIDRWLALMRAQGSRGVHLGVSAQNARALRFYRLYGFEEFVPDRPMRGVHWFVMDLSSPPPSPG
jgi:ribosomal protein S18 acetylase RimI-like enzyme